MVFSGLLFVPKTSAEPNATSIEYKLKAVFLLNFAKFIEWPDQAFSDKASSIAICIVGKDPFGGLIE